MTFDFCLTGLISSDYFRFGWSKPLSNVLPTMDFCTQQMPFLLLNQQCQSTEGLHFSMRK